jgi:hypothetical protein
MSKEDQDKAPEAFFHLDDNFSTAFIGKVPEKIAGDPNPAHDAKLISNFIDLLTNPEKRDLRTDALNTIRKTKAQQFLVDLIASPEQEKHRKELVMACWECGLDFSAHLIFFSELVTNCEYPVALEAVTVIDEMHDLTDNQKREKAIEILSSPSLSPEKQLLTSDIVEKLRQIGS